MNKIFKFIPIALGLVAMASCTNDDFLGEKSAVLSEAGGDAVNVTVEDLYPNMRSAHTASKGLKWVDGDQFRVYDAELSKYDTYEYTNATSAYTRKYTTQRVANDAISRAVFPSNYVSWTNYDEATGDVKVVMTIPDKITYNGSSEKDYAGTLAYLSNIPMQGPASYDEEYGAKLGNDTEKISYMTGIVAVTLDNVQTKATWLKLEADKAIAGSFEAIIKKGAVLKEANDGVITTPTKAIYVNIANAPRSRAIVYLPVIAQTYGDLTVSFATDEVADPTTIVPANWTEIKQFATGTPASVTVPRAGSVANSVLETAYNFQLDTHTPEALTTVLSDRRDVTGELVLNIDYLQFSKDETTSTDAQWYTIKVPNMKADVLRIQMPNGIDNNTNNRKKLVIADADDSNPYTGKVVLDLTDAATGKITNGTEKLGVEVNLDQADVTLAGNWADADRGITVTKAAVFNIGDGNVTTTIDDNITIAAITNSMTVAKNATCSGEYTLNGASAAFNYNVEGTQSATVNAGQATVNVTGMLNSRLISRGNVTVDCETSGSMGIKILSLNGNNQNINLKSGFISQINTSVAASSNYVANLYNEEKDITGIGTIDASVITLRKDGKQTNGSNAPATWQQKLVFQGSKWAGKKATGTVYIDADIYTASQLAGIAGDAADYVLWADVNLDSKPWVGVDLQKNFNGQGFTVSNLNLTEQAANAATTFGAVQNDGIGLFASTSTANVTSIKDLKISGVTFDQPANVTSGASQKYYKFANIGALVGKIASTGTLKIEKVTVTGATFSATNHKDIKAVGGLIGSVDTGAGAITLEDNNVTASITGYYALGGLVGSDDNATNAITVQKNTIKPTFAVNKDLATGKQSDANYGKVGDIVGTISIAAGVVDVKTTGGNANTITSGVATKKEVLKFRQHKNYYAISAEETQEQYYFGCQDNNNWVGFSASGALLHKDATLQTNRYTPAGNSVKDTTTPGATNFNYFVTDANTVSARRIKF